VSNGRGGDGVASAVSSLRRPSLSPPSSSYGPRDATDRREFFSPDGRLTVDYRAAGAAAAAARDVAGDPGARGPTAAEKEAAALVAAALLPAVRVAEFPRLTADVCVVVLDAGGSETAAAVVAACLALADAGVPMDRLVSAASFARVQGRLLLDPTAAETASSDGGGLVAATVGGAGPELLTQAAATGAWLPDALEDALDAGAAAAAAVGGLMRGVLAEAAARC